MMDGRQWVEETAVYVKTCMHDDGAHDWWHVYRVWQTAVVIGQQEGADMVVVQLAALLHDIGDHKFHGGDEMVGPRMARDWLVTLAVEEGVIDHVCDIIMTLSFKGAKVSTPMKTIEGMIVQDADRLDAIGAVGIARAFAYGGYAQRALYDPDEVPERHESFAAYKKSQSHTINHFYEKLLLLKARMNTSAAQQIAAQRHQFMETFLAQFFAEWDGKR